MSVLGDHVFTWKLRVLCQSQQEPASRGLFKVCPRAPCHLILAMSPGMCKKSTTVYLKSPKPENSESQMFVHKFGIN